MKYRKEKVDFYSEILNHNTFFNICIPKRAGIDQKFPLLIWLHGWGGYPDSPMLIESIENNDSLNEKPIILFPWGFEGSECSEWTNRYDGSLSMEDHIIKELIPIVQSQYPVYTHYKSIMMGGISMGGYGAINIGLKNQDLFCAISASSPQGLELPHELPEKDNKYPDFILEHIKDLATPYEDAYKLWGELPKNIDHVLNNSPQDFIDKIKVDLGIYIDVGNEGFENKMRQSAINFIQKLQKKKAHYIFEQFNGIHGGGINSYGIQRKIQFLMENFESRKLSS